ncbi:hypothetical protein K439DRAFT_1614757 [Ramaria rubella]|nr:hypothetical protein K439DRAFT_1614757 [Ramaria rubella]
MLLIFHTAYPGVVAPAKAFLQTALERDSKAISQLTRLESPPHPSHSHHTTATFPHIFIATLNIHVPRDIDDVKALMLTRAVVIFGLDWIFFAWYVDVLDRDVLVQAPPNLSTNLFRGKQLDANPYDHRIRKRGLVLRNSGRIWSAGGPIRVS